MYSLECFKYTQQFKALLKLATMKVNDRATIPTNVEGNCPLKYWCWYVLLCFMIELSVSDFAELLSTEPSKKVS